MTAGTFGLVGVVVGGLLQLLAQELATRRSRRLDAARVRLLRKMLSDEAFRWRGLATCARVVGADEETTI